MSEAEATALLSGHLGLDEDLQNSLIARNPQLASQSGAIGFTARRRARRTAGHHLPRVEPLLQPGRPRRWTYPNSKAKFGDKAGTPLGTFADYNSLTNSLGMINLATGKPQFTGEIYRKLAEKPEAVSLVTFYLTDLATARQLGLAPVAIGSDAGGLRGARRRVHQRRRVEPASRAPTASPRPAPRRRAAAAYPLTYVEYAVTPAERLVDASCKERTGAKTRHPAVARVPHLRRPGPEPCSPTRAWCR